MLTLQKPVVVANRSPIVLPDRCTHTDGRRRSLRSRRHGHVFVVFCTRRYSRPLLRLALHLVGNTKKKRVRAQHATSVVLDRFANPVREPEYTIPVTLEASRVSSLHGLSQEHASAANQRYVCSKCGAFFFLLQKKRAAIARDTKRCMNAI